jgi:glycosidase
MIKKGFYTMVLTLFTFSATAQLERVEPPNWWIGLKDNSLQLLVKGKGISSFTPNIDYPGVSIAKVHRADSENYLFIDLLIARSAQPGTFELEFTAQGEKKLSYDYELKARTKNSDEFKGFDSSDVIYLITPDRFANGDPQNDIIRGMKEERIDRKDNYARHGGDIKGIADHLDYIDGMGFTAIWSCPLLTNDMKSSSYHGYAITDLYQIDPRFGKLEDYQNLSERAAKRGIKVIMDQVANHCGSEHWWMKDLPFKDWVNYQTPFRKGEKTTYSNHRRTSNQDLYASEIDQKEMADGWFTDSMPDLNQRNPFMAKYLVQNSIWWIETAQLEGIRQDTYPYPDKQFMSDWAGAIMREYPNFSIVGEEWSYNPLLVAYWQTGANNKDGYESNLRSSMDFPMQRLIVQAVTEDESWDKGLVKVYEGLANDFHYASPKDIMIFPDNHDMDRIHTQTGEDPVLTQMALSCVLLLPRIPQVYYGTEILMQNSDKPGDHGLIRTDFPGGWDGDEVNAFTGEGLDPEQAEMQEFTRSLLRYRKDSKAIHRGRTVHFAPEDGVYVLFRTLDDETVVLILNKNEEKIRLDLGRFAEMNLEGTEMTDVVTKKTILWKDQLELTSKGAMILSNKAKH